MTEQHIGLARDLGLDTVSLMIAHMTGPEALAEQALLMESYGAQTVYCTDSAGYMLPVDVTARIAALRARGAEAGAEIGFTAITISAWALPIPVRGGGRQAAASTARPPGWARARSWLEGVVTFVGRQDSLAVRKAAIIALTFNDLHGPRCHDVDHADGTQGRHQEDLSHRRSRSGLTPFARTVFFQPITGDSRQDAS